MNGIQNLRMQKGITQIQLASDLGVDKSTVAKWETGKAFPRADLLPKIADLLGCSIDQLFGREAPAAE